LRVNRAIHIKPGDVRCPRCFTLDIVPSLPRGPMDRFMRLFHRIPRHCRMCGNRFYVRQDARPGGETSQNG
jgi:hypothetical protein